MRAAAVPKPIHTPSTQALSFSIGQLTRALENNETSLLLHPHLYTLLLMQSQSYILLLLYATRADIDFSLLQSALSLRIFACIISLHTRLLLRALITPR